MHTQVGLEMCHFFHFMSKYCTEHWLALDVQDLPTLPMLFCVKEVKCVFFFFSIRFFIIFTFNSEPRQKFVKDDHLATVFYQMIVCGVRWACGYKLDKLAFLSKMLHP